MNEELLRSIKGKLDEAEWELLINEPMDFSPVFSNDMEGYNEKAHEIIKEVIEIIEKELDK